MRYQTKPVVVEASQFFENQRPWPACVVARPWCTGPGDHEQDLPSVEVTQHGWQVVRDGDWIVTRLLGAAPEPASVPTVSMMKLQGAVRGILLAPATTSNRHELAKMVEAAVADVLVQHGIKITSV